MTPVTTAVVPVAGLGTRLLPATLAAPKEMLPVGGRPVVPARRRGAGGERDRARRVRDRPRQGSDRDHFAHRSGGPALEWATQPAPRGLGDAVLCAEGLDRRRAVRRRARRRDPRHARADAGRRAARRRRSSAHDAACAIAVRDVPREHTGRYGIVVADGDGTTSPASRAIVEKPDPDERRARSPSRALRHDAGDLRRAARDARRPRPASSS